MRKDIAKKTLILTLSLSVMLGLTACGHKKASKGAASARRERKEVTWDKGELSEKHKQENKEVTELFVQKIDNMSENIIKGMDVSSLLVEEAAGVVYHDKDGKEADMLKVISDAGFNWARVRVWKDPKDKDGNYYGGGNNDIDACVEIGKRATKNHLKLLVDFHYSDFWADPEKQYVPKDWEGLDIQKKADQMYNYTKASLMKLKDAGVDVGMVQIGNETNSYFCGEATWENIAKLMNSASKAIREIMPDALIAVHFTDPERVAAYQNYLVVLDNYDVDYDVFASSYYPYWHGTLENLTSILQVAADEYGKLVMVAENSYAYDPNDMDGWTNTIGTGATVIQDYSYTVNGQAREMRDVMDAVVKVGDKGIGVFYWEGGWIAVPEDENGKRKEKWDKYGCGWASKYAGDYDADAGQWFGGCSQENQALFDSDGNPLPSLYTWDLCYTGSLSEVKLDMVENAEVTIKLGDEIELPGSVQAKYNDGSTKSVRAKWEKPNKEAMQSNGPAKYLVWGEAAGERVRCMVNMVEPNFVQNYSFEEADDTVNWKIDDRSADDDEHEVYMMDKVTDASLGTHAMHWYSKNKVDLDITQEIEGLEPGKYKMRATFQGGDSTNQDIYIYCVTIGKTYKQNTEVTEYRSFSTPELNEIEVGEDGKVTVGIHVKADADGVKGPWGTVDEVLFNKVEE
ncbi:glycosyl hydrolase 53 family protein [uncultured Eubacterium sp.]|uniref:glycosyl hydrolase 53 family protein n=1 Tax=uncultured Eubacterium sp. TaxID=165185 RepID=UPI000E8D876E|nr:glycosyl hydrolase 53 family protein [uncultured Eubacterium sp.]HAH18562.1 extra-cellular endo-beta-1,4-galactanase [Eubacterium sp.]HAV90422.1 extra-cellular endo-beta-1,4-galactanase [Eubacterium sp.]